MVGCIISGPQTPHILDSVTANIAALSRAVRCLYSAVTTTVVVIYTLFT